MAARMPASQMDQDRQQHPDAQQANGKVLDALQQLQVSATGFREQQQHQANLGEAKEHFEECRRFPYCNKMIEA